MSSDPAWRIQEKVVAILERHLGQKADVRSDQYLPVLANRSRRPRQCDIVIYEGEEPRQTISIVEVQKRKGKPKINDFDGWVGKMREVGAQHLICVSEAGFPDSIEKKADAIGPTVRLLTLSELEENQWPIPRTAWSSELTLVRYDRLLRMGMEGEHLFAVDPNQDPRQLPDPYERVFRLIDGREVTPTDMVDWHLFSNPNNLQGLPRNEPFTLGVKWNWNWHEGVQYRDFHGRWVFLRSLLIHIEIFISTRELEWRASEYVQRGWGEVAWIVRGQTSGPERFDIVAPIIRRAAGRYQMGRPVTLSDHDAFFAIGDRGYRSQRYGDITHNRKINSQ